MTLSGQFYTDWYKSARRYEFKWSATQEKDLSTVTWQCYARGADSSDFFVVLWSLFLNLTVTQGTLVSSSTTVVADRVDPSSSANYFANYGLGKTSDTTAELYHLDYVYSVAKNRKPQNDCLLAQGTFVIRHTTEGKGAFTVDLQTATFGTTYYQYGSGTYSLNDTATASVVSVEGTPQIGEEATITIVADSTRYVHTLRYTFGSYEETLETDITVDEDSLSMQFIWGPIPISLLQYMPNKSSETLSIVCDTYIEGSLVGSTKASWPIAVPESAVPTAQVSMLDPTDIEPAYGYYVQSLSKLQVSTSATGVYGSTIASIVVTFETQKLQGAQATFESTPTAGSRPVTVTVTDSRGQTAVVVTYIQVEAYTKPTASILSVYRCNDQGVEQADGNNAIVVFNASVTALDYMNTAEYALQYRQAGSSVWLTRPLEDLVDTFEISSQAVQLAGIQLNQSYEVRITVTDAFNPSASLIRTITIAYALLDMHKAANALGLLHRATNPDAVTVGGDVIFNRHDLREIGCAYFTDSDGRGPYITGYYDSNGVPRFEILGSDNDEAFQMGYLADPAYDGDAVPRRYVDARTTDYIEEQGTSGIWTYRKWNSGKIELWTNSHQFPVSFTKSSIGVYYATEGNIPVPLVQNIQFASGDCTKWHYVNWASVTCNDGKNLSIRYYGLNTNGDGSTIPFSFYVIGTWK